ncbi:MAG: aldo/keto reductase [Oscillospiraceae bacterium]|nr:aldo/keto reductase [Oscillospiraceae bacterium]
MKIGQGTWQIGDEKHKEQGEITALRRGIELGMSLIDTAEMYGAGRSEELVGRAVAGLGRESYQLCSKVLPENAGRDRIFASCENSLRRLGADYLDIYLLHWRGGVPLGETVECMERLKTQGKIRSWGVSNFDVCDMEELFNLENGEKCEYNQVLYHIGSRGIEYDLLPWCKAHGVAVMAYCPLAQGGRLRRYGRDIFAEPLLTEIAEKYSATREQILLAFAACECIAIPKSSSVQHTNENAAAARLAVADSDWARLDEVFWPPSCKMHLDIE